ncbi:hypothetical protein LCGC14_0691380 [marine sediment metagenome]|uniref:Uncharacterized protein n=1 Tax=marine sediment metagenome TaxID=412755 RepID=A0A0F9QKC6_9ZZZZ
MLIDMPFYRARYDRAVERYWQNRKSVPVRHNSGTTAEPISSLKQEGIKQPTARRSGVRLNPHKPENTDKTLFDKNGAN